MEEEIKKIIEYVGEDVTREGLVKTPERVKKSFEFLTSGYKQDVKSVVNGAIFDSPGKEMIVVKNIEFYSLCEHHLLPFFGKCHIGYIPNKHILGFSKLPRIMDMFAKRFQVQERMTTEIAQAINDILKPKGVGVVLEARHLCMIMRGVEKQHSMVQTAAMVGEFERDLNTRLEFMNHIK
jgi:GTP cyclohydrolase IA